MRSLLGAPRIPVSDFRLGTSDICSNPSLAVELEKARTLPETDIEEPFPAPGTVPSQPVGIRMRRLVMTGDGPTWIVENRSGHTDTPIVFGDVAMTSTGSSGDSAETHTVGRKRKAKTAGGDEAAQQHQDGRSPLR